MEEGPARKNPVFMLDEVDKMAMDFRGDPSAALLEVLDPEQKLHVRRPLPRRRVRPLAGLLRSHCQRAAHDSAPLQDRMEVLRLHGYTEPEKTEIAKQFLVKKQLAQTGLTDKNVQFSEDAIQTVIRGYTRESGVRNLEREIGNICRKIARKVVKDSTYTAAVTAEKRSGLPRRYQIPRHDGTRKERNRPGHRPRLD